MAVSNAYHLKVLLPEAKQSIWGIRVSNIRSSHLLLINGQVVGQQGQPSSHPEEVIAKNVPYLSFANVTGNQVDIVLQIANFDFAAGGAYLVPSHLVLYKKPWRVSAVPNILIRRQEASLFYLVCISCFCMRTIVDSGSSFTSPCRIFLRLCILLAAVSAWLWTGLTCPMIGRHASSFFPCWHLLLPTPCS